jgi:hypothetical protein
MNNLTFPSNDNNYGVSPQFNVSNVNVWSRQLTNAEILALNTTGDAGRYPFSVAGVDTCACPTTADWYIGGCTIVTSCDVKGKAIYVNGTTTINYGVTVSNFTSIILTNVTTSIMKVLGVVKQK